MEPAISSAYLLAKDPVRGRTSLRLVAGQRVAIGRAPTNHVVVHDERASRFHAEIFPIAGGWAVRDLQSRNGTLLDGQPVTADRQLAAGAVLSIGQATIHFGEGDLPTDDDPEPASGTATGEMPPDIQAWHGSVVLRRSHSRFLDELRDTAGSVPRVGRAAADLCRLAFALGRAADVPAMARLALDAAVEGTGAAAGGVLLPTRFGLRPARPAATGAPPLETVAVTPASWSATAVHAGLIAAVLGSDEALLTAAGAAATISAPVRTHGRPIGLMHLELAAAAPAAGAADLEFVMTVCDALGLALDNLTVRESLSTRLASTADENVRLRRRLGEDCHMVGTSAVLQGILGQIGRVAATKATVLVRGESGTGKELVARAIHEASDRADGPFVCLNCAALSETLLESELFGHEKGAFTGATERKIGKFEAAHGGTLMLDEIGEMSPAIQAKFLRVLEGHPFERVGGSTRVQVDVRVVAATNRDLEAAVAAGQFRRDLYFRLKVVEILVPPLRRRPEDIADIAGHFLERFAAETRRTIRGFTPAALETMRGYHWPGNIRELRNCVERAVVLAQGEWIDVADVALSTLAAPGETGRLPAAVEPFEPATIDEIERRHVLATLAAVGHNKTKAATMLGIERSTLDRKLAKWTREE